MRLLPSLFLGVLMGAALVFVLRFPVWHKAAVFFAAQIGVSLFWWLYYARERGVLIRVPYILWLLVLTGGDILFLVVSQNFFRTIILIAVSLFLSLSFWFWFSRFQFAPEYQKHYLSRWYFAVTSFAIFVWSAPLFALFSQLRFPSILTTAIISILAAVFTVLNLFAPTFIHGLGTIQKEILLQSFWSLIAVFLIFFQFVWVLHFLPFGFFVNAAVLTFLFAGLNTFVNTYINNRKFSLNEKALLTILGILVILVFVLARWV